MTYMYWSANSRNIQIRARNCDSVVANATKNQVQAKSGVDLVASERHTVFSVNPLTSKENDITCGLKVRFIQIDIINQTLNSSIANWIAMFDSGAFPHQSKQYSLTPKIEMATPVQNRPIMHCKPLSIEYVMYVQGLCLFYLTLRSGDNFLPLSCQFKWLCKQSQTSDGQENLNCCLQHHSKYTYHMAYQAFMQHANTDKFLAFVSQILQRTKSQKSVCVCWLGFGLTGIFFSKHNFSQRCPGACFSKSH